MHVFPKGWKVFPIIKFWISVIIFAELKQFIFAYDINFFSCRWAHGKLYNFKQIPGNINSLSILRTSVCVCVFYMNRWLLIHIRTRLSCIRCWRSQLLRMRHSIFPSWVHWALSRHFPFALHVTGGTEFESGSLAHSRTTHNIRFRYSTADDAVSR